MRRIFTADQVRDAEDVLLARTPEGALMRRAAYGVAREAVALLREHAGGVTGRRVALLVGAGNNGGDALWAGFELRRRGVRVDAVLLVPDRAHPAGLAALRGAKGRVHELGDPATAAVRSADLVIDGVVGISGRGPLREPAAALVDVADAAGVPILAVDLPSGVDPDTGAVDGPAVNAAATVTFGAYKPVHVLAPVRCGAVRLVDLGLGPHLPVEPHLWVLERADVATRWPIPGPDDDKYTQGVVGVAAGSATYPGAAVLASGAAVAATSGMVRFAGSAADEVRSRWPEVVAAGSVADTGRTQAWTAGPGLGTGSASRETVAAILERGVPTCLDADAITLLANTPDLADALMDLPAVLTPHAGEFARLFGEVGTDRVASVRRAAANLRVTVLLKGHVTVIADPSGRTCVHPSTESWAATAGSGDVLSGMIGALLAAGLEPWWAAACAAHVHSLAATIAAHGDPGPTSFSGGAVTSPVARAVTSPGLRAVASPGARAVASPGAPIGASALLAAIPDAIRTVRAT
jgi:hydroxyethylthiazole kinase-like uncharacterized protein yjeF